MTPADLEQLRKHKSELLAHLNREATNIVVDPDGSCPTWQERVYRTAPTFQGNVPDLTGQKVLSIVCPITGTKIPVLYLSDPHTAETYLRGDGEGWAGSSIGYGDQA
jgi:hypothetical protein